MAIAIGKESQQLFALLAKAANVEAHKVRSIECRCSVGEAVTFRVELIGERAYIESALGEAVK